jgi:hypothetical protein
MQSPRLSIVIPMRENVSISWLQSLLTVEGNAEFVLVYPPDIPFIAVHESRLRQIRCPLRGEVIQRVTALLNTLGHYVLSINCDEYLHPKIVEIAENYFNCFPDSYFFRLNSMTFPFGKMPTDQPWVNLPEMESIIVRNRTPVECSPSEERPSKEQDITMREIPITPLDNPIDPLAIFRGRRDQEGPHQENFDKKVWKNALVQETLKDIAPTFKLFGPFKYIPFWTADRLLGLSVQAKFFEPGKIVGHWLPSPAQLRTEENPPDQPRKNRRYVLSELSILRKFPRFGYIWNLTVFDQGGIFMVWFPTDTLRAMAKRLGLKKV